MCTTHVNDVVVGKDATPSRWKATSALSPHGRQIHDRPEYHRAWARSQKAVCAILRHSLPKNSQS